MRTELGEPKPGSNFVEPAIEFPLKLSYNNFESLLGIEGTLLAGDGKILAGLAEKVESRSLEIGEIGTRGSHHDKGLEREKPLDISLVALLSKGALDHISNVRDKNPKKDVVFKLQLRLRTLHSKALTSPLHLVAPAEIGPPIRELLETTRRGSLVTYQYERDYSAPQGNLWLISGDNAPIFLQIRDVSQEIPVEIAASDWLHDFALQLGMGRFAIVELVLPSLVAAGEGFAEKLNEAIKALPKMEAKFNDGEWNEVIEKSRPIFELLTKSKDTVKSLIMEEQGYSEEAATALTAAVGSLFDYGSKFVKKTKKGELLPKINAEKEDAYLIYSLSISLVNLLTQKIRKSGTL